MFTGLESASLVTEEMMEIAIFVDGVIRHVMLLVIIQNCAMSVKNIGYQFSPPICTIGNSTTFTVIVAYVLISYRYLICIFILRGINLSEL